MSTLPNRRDASGKLSRCYRKWSSMLQRCENPKHIAFRYYGDAGVRVCARWHSYDAFYQDMGDPPPGTWLDREHNDRGYEPGNCRWVTTSESAANRKPRGPVSGSLKDRCRQAGLPYHVVYQRIRSGLWSEAKALSTPVLPRTRRLDVLDRGT